MTTQILAREPIGVTLHNPLNLRPTQPPFEGTVGSRLTGAGEFTEFQSNVFGFRAAARNLIAYYDGRLGQKINTIKGIISHWAPSSENDTGAYIAAVCNRTGYQAEQPLETKTYEVAYNVLHAMTVQEQGSFDTYFKPWELTEGLRRAGIADVPASPLHKRITAIGGAIAVAATVAPQIQATIQQYSPPADAVATFPWLHTVFVVLGLFGGALSIYGSIQLARKQGV